MSSDLLLAESGPGDGNDDGVHALTPKVVGNSDHRDLGDRVEGRGRPLDLDGVHVLATGA